MSLTNRARCGRCDGFQRHDQPRLHVRQHRRLLAEPVEKDPLLGGHPRDKQGNILPNKRFPDMKALTDYIHGKGLKAGIYYVTRAAGLCPAMKAVTSTRNRTPGNSPRWGFDFLNYDWCEYSRIEPHPDLAGLQKPYRKMGGGAQVPGS